MIWAECIFAVVFYLAVGILLARSNVVKGGRIVDGFAALMIVIFWPIGVLLAIVAITAVSICQAGAWLITWRNE